MTPARPIGQELDALARALVAAAPSHADIAQAELGSPGAQWRALLHTDRPSRLPEVFATLNGVLSDVPFTAAPGLIVALVALSSELLDRLAVAVDRPVDDLRADVFREMAALSEGLEPPPR
jgi:hypothetical protein